MKDTDAVLSSYIAIWNETDAERRRELISRTPTDDAIYIDPVMSGEGAEQIDAMVAAAQQQFPGHRFTLLDGADAHHGRVRFSWSLAPAGADEPVALGVDFALLAEDGRMCEVTGFLEPAA